jgi:hypothetical protein
MRRVLTLGLLAALAVPAVAAATALAPGDGTLYVNNADGRVHFLRGFSGVVLGRITFGTLEVFNPSGECDEVADLVWDDDERTERPLRGSRDGIKCVFRATDRTTPMRFRLLEESEEIRISGQGIWVSAVGQGRVHLQGSDRLRDGTFSISGDRPRSMPDRGATYSIGTRPSLP